MFEFSKINTMERIILISSEITILFVAFEGSESIYLYHAMYDKRKSNMEALMELRILTDFPATQKLLMHAVLKITANFLSSLCIM